MRSQYPLVEVHVQHVDISNEESVQAFIDGCVVTYGRVDYANNVAGVVPSRLPITETDVSTYDLINNVNLYGVSVLFISSTSRSSFVKLLYITRLCC